MATAGAPLEAGGDTAPLLKSGGLSDPSLLVGAAALA